MSENGYYRRSNNPIFNVEIQSNSGSAPGPRFEFKIDKTKISRGWLVSVTRLIPMNTKVKVVSKCEIPDAVKELKEKLSKGNI